jgi:hypothetical protein
MSDDFTDALFIAQTLVQRRLADGPLTREVIADGVDRTLAVEPRWRATVDPEALCRELETRFNIWIGQEQTLIGRDDHVAWLDAGRKHGWRYWGRYRQHLASDLAPASLDAIDRVTDHVLGLLEDPQREGRWDRRGLVVGHVQSGKTASYIGLICKAADAGYKLVVVLAGLHKNLRSQTQMRLDEGFLGYETMPPGEVERRAPQPAGVGLLDPTLRPNYVTNRSDNGDFSRAVANNMGINPGADPLLFVVKKNARVLRNLLDWVHWAANAREPETGRPLVRDVPLLVIDDEADHASVDTREQAFDENGNPDPDHDPTAINGCIRRLLRAFEKTAYVGYTATPFANIFIHERGETTDEGEDLFPRSFIVNLSAPSNYVGPTRVFGLEPQNEGEGFAQLPLIRHVADHADSLNLNERNGWMPPSHRNGHVPLCNGVAELPLSLQEAIRAFVLSCAARRARGQNREHNTMLVHVTRYTAVQQLVRDQIDAYLASLRLRLRHGDGSRPDALEIELRELWERDFEPTTLAVVRVADDRDIVAVSWESVRPHLANVADDIHIRQINGTAGDILEYERHQETGLNVIAVGGDKLSRGLTLAGLTVSYFLRASRMYDTLMQMGRWFGYRPGYLDLCRLYTTADLEQWFQHIAEAGEELRREFDHMAAVGGTPRDYGLKVRSHPVLMVTSQVKMRHGTTLHLSFESDTPETVVFHRDADVITRNLRTSTLLLSRLGVPSASPVVAPRAEGSHQWDSTHLWRGIPATHVLGFLSGYTTHPSAIRVNTRLLTEYIERQNARGELVQWTVVLLGNGEGSPMELEGLGVRLTKRAPNQRSRSVEEQRRDGLMIIRRLLSPRDVAVDLNAGQYAEALRLTHNAWQADPGRSSAQTPPDYPSTRAVASQRDPSTGLLLIYPVDPEPAGLDTRMPVMGFGISFPHSTGAPQVAYEVNNVYWTQEVAGA